MSPKIDPWVRLFDVNETKHHPKGYTIYKITSTVFPKNSPEAATQVIVWKRFSEIKKLYKSLHSLHLGLHLKGNFPDFPKDKIFGRFEPSIIEERRESALRLLEFVARYPPLFTSQVFLKFFESVPSSPECKEDSVIIHDKPTLTPVKVNSPISSSQQNSESSIRRDEPAFHLGGVWQYRQPQDNVSLDSNDDFGDGVTNKEGVDTFETDVVLDLFDPCRPSTDDDGNDTSASRSSWLYSALASCSDFVDADAMESQDPYEFPKAFEEFKDDQHNVECKVRPLDGVDLTQSVERGCLQDSNGRPDSSCASPASIRGQAPSVDWEDSHKVLARPFDAASLSDQSSPVFTFGNEPVVEYLLEAAHILKLAKESESVNDYEKAFEQYKMAVEVLLCGVQEDLEANRRANVKRKIDKYLQRAEEIYKTHLCMEDRDNDQLTALHCGMSKHMLWNLSSSKSGLGGYKVLGVLGKVLLVLDSSTNLTYVIKVLSKASNSACPPRPYIVPHDIEHMVQLIRFHETENSVFLVLQHAVGGKLWSYVSSYLTGENCVGFVRQDSKGDGNLEDGNIYAGRKLREKVGDSNSDCESLRSSESTDADAVPPLDPPKDCCPSYFDLVTEYIATSPTRGRVPLAKCELGSSDGTATNPISGRDDGETNFFTDPYCDGLISEGLGNNGQEETISWINLEDVDPKELISNAQKLMQHVEETLRESDKVIGMLDGTHSLTVTPESEVTLRRKSLPSSVFPIARPPSDATRSRRPSNYMSKDVFASSVHDVRTSRNCSGGSLELQRNRMRHFSAVFRQLDECRTKQSPSLPESCIKVWAAEIVAAVSNLHSVGLMCRDLRPDNVLLGERGHVLLSYFSQWPNVNATVDPMAKRFLYTAPEIGGIFKVTPACDWWSVGTLLFELFTGKTLVSVHPEGFTRHTQLQIPCTLSAEVNSLLKGLLCYYPNERLGGGANGDDSVKAHPYFRGIDWNSVRLMEYPT